jgi:hypothetical protein
MLIQIHNVESNGNANSPLKDHFHIAAWHKRQIRCGETMEQSRGRQRSLAKDTWSASCDKSRSYSSPNALIVCAVGNMGPRS